MSSLFNGVSLRMVQIGLDAPAVEWQGPMGQPIAGPPHGFKGAIMKDIRKGQKSAAGRKAPPAPAGKRATLPRALSKLGFCSRTQAEELGLGGQGIIAPGALADLAVLDSRLAVVATYVGGALASSAVGAAA